MAGVCSAGIRLCGPEGEARRFIHPPSCRNRARCRAACCCGVSSASLCNWLGMCNVRPFTLQIIVCILENRPAAIDRHQISELFVLVVVSRHFIRRQSVHLFSAGLLKLSFGKISGARTRRACTNDCSPASQCEIRPTFGTSRTAIERDNTSSPELKQDHLRSLDLPRRSISAS